MPELFKGFIINPTIEVTPDIRISPFRNHNMLDFMNGDLNIGENLMDLLFSNYLIIDKARNGIVEILKALGLKKNDVVTILTTSGNYYISHCVTDAIESVCKWNRKISKDTKAFFVNHEFGYYYENIKKLKLYGLPIIEDSAHLFSPRIIKESIGDFVIYSLPKRFPMQIGCIIQQNNPNYELKYCEKGDIKDYVIKSLSLYLPKIDEFNELTINNFNFIKKYTKSLGITPLFKLRKYDIPNVFLFKFDQDIDYDKLKIFMYNNGIESSVFYKQNAYFVPCNHGVTINELNYIINLLQFYKNNL